jgi:cysteine desulfurase/selenocysteine lyase
MANEFFTNLPALDALPDRAGSLDATPRVAAFGSAPLASAPATIPAAPPEISLPSDPHLPGVPAGAGPAVVAPVSAPIQPNAPAFPGVTGEAPGLSPVEPPVFSFLQDSRPIVSDLHTSPQAPYPQAKPMSQIMAAPSPSAGKTPSAPESARIDDGGLKEVAKTMQPPSPALPASAAPVDSSAVPAFSFLEDARPLFSYPPTTPGSAPAFPHIEKDRSPREDESWGSTVFGRSQPPGHAGPQWFGFVEDARGLSPDKQEQRIDPAVIDSGLESDVPGKLNLSSYPFDAQAIKRDFPILRERVNGRPLVWLDNAATTQKPQSVIDRLKYFYEHENSNVHRAAHELAARATDAYESAREKVRHFVNAPSTREIIFVRGATEGINLVAQSWGRRNIQKDDEIVITWLEHHANIVPWQMLCAEKGARLRVAPVDNTGQIILDEYEKLLNARTRLVALPMVSNALGVIPPVREMIEAAHRYGAMVLLDGAQSVSHMRTDVQSLDCDFFVFSGHKVFAPTGIGVVYGKLEVLEHMPPWQGGGNMIQDVTFEKTVYQPAPQRFEAGTGNIADAVGLGAAVDYLDRVGMETISRYEHGLLVYATESLQRIPGLRIIGTAPEKAGVISFVLEGFRTEEVGDFLNRNGIAVRSGHHCAQPILRRFGLESTVRASLALYNTAEDIDALCSALWDLRQGRHSIA